MYAKPKEKQLIQKSHLQVEMRPGLLLCGSSPQWHSALPIKMRLLYSINMDLWLQCGFAIIGERGTLLLNGGCIPLLNGGWFFYHAVPLKW